MMRNGFNVYMHWLLKASFRPESKIVELRSYFRVRERLSDYAAAHIQHMQKALTFMNVQLNLVVSDITGVTGMKIIRAIVDGMKNPGTLAEYRDPRCKASKEMIKKALTGNYQAEHMIALKQALAMFDAYQIRIHECDDEIENVLAQLSVNKPIPDEPLPKPKHKTKQPNQLNFDVRKSIYQLVGNDIT